MARKRPPATPIAPEPPSGVRKRSQPGMFVEYEWRGIKCIRKWPRRRTAAENAKHFASCQLFIDRIKQMKEELAVTQVAAARMSQGTQLLARDVQLMIMSNTLYGAIEINGQLYWPVHIMTEVSTALDVLAREPGSILYRGPEGWVGLVPGQAGNVLTMEGSPPRPVWAPGGGGGGGGLIPRWTIGTSSSTSYATKGSLIDPDWTVQARALVAAIRPAVTGNFRMRLFRLAGDTIAEKLAEGPAVQMIEAQPAGLRYDLPGPITLLQGERYAVTATFHGPADTSILGTYTTALPIEGLPFNGRNPRWLRMAKRDPQPGDVFEVGGAGATANTVAVEA